MFRLRKEILTTPPATLGILPTKKFPRVYGILMELPLDGGHTATVVSLSDGNASLYTTSTFGVIGGVAHKSIRNAVSRFVRAAENYYDDSLPAYDYPYPEQGRVRFYLLTFRGIKVIDADLDSVSRGKDKYSNLFELGQTVLTEIRHVSGE